MTTFQPGDPIFWWKRVTRAIDYPYRGEVVAVGPKRVTIEVQDPDDPSDRYIRHVVAESLQPVGRYFVKAVGQGPHMLEPLTSWGLFTFYAEVGEDLFCDS